MRDLNILMSADNSTDTKMDRKRRRKKVMRHLSHTSTAAATDPPPANSQRPKSPKNVQT